LDCIGAHLFELVGIVGTTPSVVSKMGRLDAHGPPGHWAIKATLNKPPNLHASADIFRMAQW
jgi:hypothetical protein